MLGTLVGSTGPEAFEFRISVLPDPENGLMQPSRIMADRIVTSMWLVDTAIRRWLDH